MTQEEQIPELKKKFLEYYGQLPIIRLACGYIGRNEDTIYIWKKDDSVFSEQMDNARSNFAMKNFKGVRSKEWVLERTLRDHFSPKTDIDVKSNGERITGINFILPDGTKYQTNGETTGSLPDTPR